MNSRRSVVLLALIHIVTIALALFLLRLSGDFGDSKEIADLLLSDDGYYGISKDFAAGGSLLHREKGFALPLLFTVLHSFPPPFHPYLRLIMTVLFNIGSLIVVRSITARYLSGQEFFWGGLFVVLNPVFIHFSLKSTPEPYLAFFLLLFTYFFLRCFNAGSDIKNFIPAVFFFVFSIFIRPSVLLIPAVLFVLGVFLGNKKLCLRSSALVCACCVGFIAFGRLTETRGQVEAAAYTTGVHDFIWDSYLIDNIIRSKRVEKGTLLGRDSDESNQFLAEKQADRWEKQYLENHPGAGTGRLFIDFVRDNEKLVIQKLILNPIFIFTLGSRQVEFYINLLVTGLTLGLVSVALFRLPKDTGLWIILAVVFGYLLTFIIIHVAARYSLGIIPLLYVFAGKGLLTAFGKLRKATVAGR